MSTDATAAMSMDRSYPTIFETERLLARSWTLDDAPAALAMYGDPEVMRYLGRDGSGAVVGSIKEMQERLGRAIEKYRDWNGFLYAALELRATGSVIGTILLKPLELTTGEPTEDEIEIGWHLNRAHWGMGYGTEAGSSVLRYAFETLPVDEIHAIAYPENIASLRIMQKIGMERVGQTDRYFGVTTEHYLAMRP